MGIIYKVTNKINGKEYIGQTKLSLKKRKKLHEKLALRKIWTSYFYNALKKYGTVNFKWEVVEKVSNKILNEKEIYYINKFNTFNKGYNMTTGGEGGYVRSEETKKLLSEIASKKTGSKNPFYGKGKERTGSKNPFYGKKHSEETKRKNRKAHLGKKLSKEHRKKISESLKGEKNPFYGKKHSEETKKLMSIKRRKLL